MYGMSYGLCKEPAGTKNGCANSTVGACGFRLDHNISLYASIDLSSGSQKLISKNILPIDARPSGIYFAPKVKPNEKTGMYVLWVNYLYKPQIYGFARSQYLTATSPTPEGPFRIITENATVNNLPGGDFDIFVDDDDDKTAYIIYTSNLVAKTDSHRMSIERLTPDYTNSRDSLLAFGESFVEAPVMFKRKRRLLLSFLTVLLLLRPRKRHRRIYGLALPGPWKRDRRLEGTQMAHQSRVQQRSTFWFPAGATGSKSTDTLVWQGNRVAKVHPTEKRTTTFFTWLPVTWSSETESMFPDQLVWKDDWELLNAKGALLGRSLEGLMSSSLPSSDDWVSSSDSFTYSNIIPTSGKVMYLEPENVTTNAGPCGGGWSVGGQVPLPIPAR